MTISEKVMIIKRLLRDIRDPAKARRDERGPDAGLPYLVHKTLLPRSHFPAGKIFSGGKLRIVAPFDFRHCTTAIFSNVNG